MTYYRLSVVLCRDNIEFSKNNEDMSSLYFGLHLFCLFEARVVRIGHATSPWDCYVAWPVKFHILITQNLAKSLFRKKPNFAKSKFCEIESGIL